VKLKVDKTLVASAALHVLVIGWGLVTFSSKAFDAMFQKIPQFGAALTVVTFSAIRGG